MKNPFTEMAARWDAAEGRRNRADDSPSQKPATGDRAAAVALILQSAREARGLQPPPEPTNETAKFILESARKARGEK
jgi:hypothetical protein